MFQVVQLLRQAGVKFPVVQVESDPQPLDANRSELLNNLSQNANLLGMWR